MQKPIQDGPSLRLAVTNSASVLHSRGRSFSALLLSLPPYDDVYVSIKLLASDRVVCLFPRPTSDLIFFRPSVQTALRSRLRGCSPSGTARPLAAPALKTGMFNDAKKDFLSHNSQFHVTPRDFGYVQKQLRTKLGSEEINWQTETQIQQWAMGNGQ